MLTLINKWFFSFLWLFFPLCLLTAPIPLFLPPEGWEYAMPENSSSFIQAGFIGKGSSSFRPSINLALEEIDVSPKQYYKAVKNIHLADSNTSCRDLGKFMTEAGEGRLLEITTVSSVGSVKMLQMIMIKEKTAYILTGAAIKEEYLHLHPLFTKTFHSLVLVPDLFSPLTPDKKKLFEECFASIEKSTQDAETKWADLQKKVFQEGTEMGLYWQLLVLKEGWLKCGLQKK